MYEFLINIKMIFFIFYVYSFLKIYVNSEFYQATIQINETTKETYCIASEEHKYSKINYLNSPTNDSEMTPIECKIESNWGYYDNNTKKVDKQEKIICKPHHRTISTLNEGSILRIYPGEYGCIKFKLNMCKSCKLQVKFKGRVIEYNTSDVHTIYLNHSTDLNFTTTKTYTSGENDQKIWCLSDITHCFTENYIKKLTLNNQTVECLFDEKNISSNLNKYSKSSDECVKNCSKLLKIFKNTSYCHNFQLISNTRYCNSSIPEKENFKLYLLLLLVPVIIIIFIIIIFIFRRRKNNSMKNTALKTSKEESGQNKFVENEVYESFSINAGKTNERNIVEIENYELYEPYTGNPTVKQNSSNIKPKNNQLCMTSTENQNCVENNGLYETINGD